MRQKNVKKIYIAYIMSLASFVQMNGSRPAAPPTLSGSSLDLTELPSLVSYELHEDLAAHAKEFEESEAKRHAAINEIQEEQAVLKETYKALDRELKQQPGHMLKKIEKQRVENKLWDNLDTLQRLGGSSSQKARTSLFEFIQDPNPDPVPKSTMDALKDLVLKNPKAFGGNLLKLVAGVEAETPKFEAKSPKIEK